MKIIKINISMFTGSVPLSFLHKTFFSYIRQVLFRTPLKKKDHIKCLTVKAVMAISTICLVRFMNCFIALYTKCS